MNHFMSIFIALWFLVKSQSVFESGHSSYSRRAKRIVGGVPLGSHDDYDTHFLIEMRYTYWCISDQLDHVMEDCENFHVCAGSLIAADFILTACHCITYETFYFDTSNLPDIKKITPAELRTSFNWNVFVNSQPLHPLLNAMTLWAGSVNTDNFTPQKRHAKAFFPHSLCMERQTIAFPELWNRTNYEYDIGLVLTCEKFQLNEDVKLAPILHGYMLLDQLNAITRKGAVCLVVGWGLTDKAQEDTYPSRLQHTFRYLECHWACDPTRRCSTCSHHIGPKISYPSSGDSGGPVICDRYVISVMSRGRERLATNYTVHIDFPIACVKDYIAGYHLDYLRSMKPEVFHWMGGSPVPMTTERTEKSSRYQFRSNVPQLKLPCTLLIAIFILCTYLSLSSGINIFNK